MYTKNIIAVLLLAVLITPLCGSEKRPMSLVDILEIPSLSDPQLSPDGRQILFSRSKADWDKNKHMRHIWRINADGTGLLQLTNGSGREHSACWSPCGKLTAFIDRRKDDKKSQIYLINNSGGEAVCLSKHKTSVSKISWTPDGTALYFLALDPLTKEEKKNKEIKNDVYAFEKDLKPQHLWKISVSSRTEEKITDGSYSVLDYKLSQDGSKIIFTRADSRIRDDTDYSEVWLMGAEGKNIMQLTKNKVSENNAELSPDNSHVLFICWGNEKFEPYYNNNLFIMPADGGPVKMLLPDMPYEVRRARWSSDGKSIYFTANMGVHTELFKVDVKTSTLEQLTNGRHTLKSWDYLPEQDIHLFRIDSPENPGDLWLLASNEKSDIQRITHVYDYLSQQFELPKQEAVQWQGKDGVTVEGLLCYPLGYKKGKKYPLAVLTHGGPRSSDKYSFGRWRTYIPVLAAKGYAVLKPNYRGSTGYGDDFLRDMVGSYFNQSHLDVMAGVDYLIEQGIADGNRLVKAGWSAGGHMTNKIITFTDRFKAASSGAGAVNWISMYGQSDTRSQRTAWFGGTPWQHNAPIKNYWDSSPLKDIAKVKTPAIIFVGENDPRVPMPQSVELYRALKSNGVPTALYAAPREKHGWKELRHQLFKMNAELQWFEKYANNRDFIHEQIPHKEKKDE